MSTESTTAAVPDTAHGGGHDGHHHILPLSVYYSVASALFFLTIITVWVAQFDFGDMNTVVAMAVAAFKASLVALYFMHLKYDNKLYSAFFVGSLVVLATFIIFIMFDTESRHRVYEETSVPIQQHAVIYGEDGKPLNTSAHHGDEGHGEEGAASHGEEGAADSHGADDAAGGAHDGDATAGDAPADEQPAAVEGGH